MRLVLAVYLLLACVALGYRKSHAIAARLRSLHAFSEELPRLLLRMSYEALPLKNLADSMAEQRTKLTAVWRCDV